VCVCVCVCVCLCGCGVGEEEANAIQAGLNPDKAWPPVHSLFAKAAIVSVHYPRDVEGVVVSHLLFLALLPRSGLREPPASRTLVQEASVCNGGDPKLSSRDSQYTHKSTLDIMSSLPGPDQLSLIHGSPIAFPARAAGDVHARARNSGLAHCTGFCASRPPRALVPSRRARGRCTRTGGPLQIDHTQVQGHDRSSCTPGIEP
jgi:hypothetical protein